MVMDFGHDWGSTVLCHRLVWCRHRPDLSMADVLNALLLGAVSQWVWDESERHQAFTCVLFREGGSAVACLLLWYD